MPLGDEGNNTGEPKEIITYSTFVTRKSVKVHKVDEKNGYAMLSNEGLPRSRVNSFEEVPKSSGCCC